MGFSQEATVVLGLYPTRASLEVGVQALKIARFRKTDISVLSPHDWHRGSHAPGNTESASGGAARGGTGGGLPGGVLGWLTDAGKLTIPELGQFVATGPLAAAVVAACAEGAIGGVAGGVTALGVSRNDAQRYQEKLKDGLTLLAVRTDNAYWTTRAREILEHTGAQEISTFSEAGDKW